MGRRFHGDALQGPQLTQDLAEGLSQYDGYKNSASRSLIANVQAGKTYPDAAAPDDQAHSLIKVPIVVARYIGMHSTLATNVQLHVNSQHLPRQFTHLASLRRCWRSGQVYVICRHCALINAMVCLRR